MYFFLRNDLIYFILKRKVIKKVKVTKIVFLRPEASIIQFILRPEASNNLENIIVLNILIHIFKVKVVVKIQSEKVKMTKMVFWGRGLYCSVYFEARGLKYAREYHQSYIQSQGLGQN